MKSKSKKSDWINVAAVAINDASSMTPRERLNIAEWLRETAKLVVKSGDKMSKRFTASYRAPLR